MTPVQSMVEEKYHQTQDKRINKRLSSLSQEERFPQLQDSQEHQEQEGQAKGRTNGQNEKVFSSLTYCIVTLLEKVVCIF